MSEFAFTELFPLGHDDTPYRLLSTEGVSVVDTPLGEMLRVSPAAITLLTREAMHDIAHFLRPGHLQQLRNILDDADASPNDHFVALELLKNANIAAGMILPMCQDTGTAIIMGKKGQRVWSFSTSLRQPRRFAMTKGTAAPVAIVALDPHLDELRARLGWFVGLDRHVAIDDAIDRLHDPGPRRGVAAEQRRAGASDRVAEAEMAAGALAVATANDRAALSAERLATTQKGAAEAAVATPLTSVASCVSRAGARSPVAAS